MSRQRNVDLDFSYLLVALSLIALLALIIVFGVMLKPTPDVSISVSPSPIVTPTISPTAFYEQSATLTPEPTPSPSPVPSPSLVPTPTLLPTPSPTSVSAYFGSLLLDAARNVASAPTSSLQVMGNESKASSSGGYKQRVQDIATGKATLSPYQPTYSYIGNKNTGVFHYPSCSSVDQMKSSNKVYLESRDDAIDSGYRPCQRCNP